MLRCLETHNENEHVTYSKNYHDRSELEWVWISENGAFFFFDEVEIGFPYGMNKDLRAIIQTMLGFLFIIDYSSNIGFFYVL